ncbi:hypothetical protein EB796_002117 [Bugula neritina]|uniref:Receptor-type tyrosine-protein phosphatase U-like Fn3 domain-containing protein n=1 Tax=Bugula neritina TaxID=10212 RepID=A0A7J7KN42_BUGNE|nr:hypothetical protein EB796_002117 [Bugula neritina]
MVLSYLILVQRKTRSKRAVSSSNCIPSSDSQSVSRSSLTLTQSCYITAEILANDTKLSTPGGYEFTVGDGQTYNGYINTKLIPSAKYDVWRAVTWIPKGATEELITVLSERQEFQVRIYLTSFCNYFRFLCCDWTISCPIHNVCGNNCIWWKTPFLKRKLSIKKYEGPRVPTEDDRNKGLAYELSSPSVPGDEGQPTYMNKAFEKEDVTYESLQDQPTTSDHVYTSVEN